MLLTVCQDSQATQQHDDDRRHLCPAEDILVEYLQPAFSADVDVFGDLSLDVAGAITRCCVLFVTHFDIPFLFTIILMSGWQNGVYSTPKRTELMSCIG